MFLCLLPVTDSLAEQVHNSTIKYSFSLCYLLNCPLQSLSRFIVIISIIIIEKKSVEMTRVGLGHSTLSLN